MRAVITFHAIDDGPAPLSFSPADLRSLLRALDGAGIPVLPLDRLLDASSPSGVALTFDDGLRSVHDLAMPILAEHGAVGHVFAITGSIGRDNRWPGQPASAARYDLMGWDQLAAIAARGMLIEGHTHTHPDLRQLGEAAIAEEMDRANDQVERHTGRRPQFFAYPYGHHDDRVRAAARRRYAAAFTTRLAFLPPAIDLAAVPRLDSHYLRSPHLVARLGTPAGRGYIEFRRLLRGVRGWAA